MLGFRKSISPNRKKLLEGFTPPTFEPITQCPKGTWYKEQGDHIEIGAKLPRGIRFVTAWFSVIAILAFAIFELVAADEPIEPLWIFGIIMGVPFVIATGFALYLTSAVRIRVRPDSMEFIRGIWFLTRKRKFAMNEIVKLRVIPRTTTYTTVSDGDVSYATIDFSKGSGLTMALVIETEQEELEIARDLDLDRTFYLRYAIMQGRKGELDFGFMGHS